MKAIVGPVHSDLSLVGLTAARVTLCSAFYTRGVLDEIHCDAANIDLAVRIDLDSLEDWIFGLIDPEALLRFTLRHKAAGAKVQIWGSADAHAKLYVGKSGYLIGSANLTRKGLSGIGNEMLWLEKESARRSRIELAIRKYKLSLKQISLIELTSYVEQNRAHVLEQASKRRTSETDENKLPIIRNKRARPTGDYGDFKRWLAAQPEPAADVILERANGAGQLGGHIHRNFYGLRQLLVARPSLLARMLNTDPNKYSLAADGRALGMLRGYVLEEASDEQDFKVDTWRTYLPVGGGGKPKSGGGTSGNLNRMLPLIARYLVTGKY